MIDSTSGWGERGKAWRIFTRWLTFSSIGFIIEGSGGWREPERNPTGSRLKGQIPIMSMNYLQKPFFEAWQGSRRSQVTNRTTECWSVCFPKHEQMKLQSDPHSGTHSHICCCVKYECWYTHRQHTHTYFNTDALNSLISCDSPSFYSGSSHTFSKSLLFLPALPCYWLRSIWVTLKKSTPHSKFCLSFTVLCKYAPIEKPLSEI